MPWPAGRRDPGSRGLNVGRLLPIEGHVRRALAALVVLAFVVLASTADVVEWTKGTTLTRMRRHFSPEAYDAFVAEYRRRLVEQLGDRRPYYYAFKRILLHARR